jgi:acyl carrier protein
MTVTSTLNEQSLLDIVCQAAAIVMDVSAGELDGETRLIDDLNADSLALIEIVEVTEDLLRTAGTSVRVDDGTLARLTTLGELVAALRDEVAGQRSETEV